MTPSAPTAIELRHLRYFLAVVDQLHFGRAADQLNISQPPLSQAVCRLEAELGVPLFDRTSRTVTATAAGLAFAEQAREILARVDLAVAEARRAGGGGGVLRIGCVPHLPMARLQAFLKRLHDLEPAAVTQVTHLMSGEQRERLRRSELDLAIFHYVEPLPDFEMAPLFAGEPLVAYLAPSHPLAAKDVLGPDDLRDEVIVTFPHAANPALSEALRTMIGGAGYHFRAVSEASSWDARDLILPIAEGHGISFYPSSLKDITEAGDMVILRALDPPLSMPDTMIAWRSEPARTLRPVLDHVRQVAAELRQSSA